MECDVGESAASGSDDSQWEKGHPNKTYLNFCWTVCVPDIPGQTEAIGVPLGLDTKPGKCSNPTKLSGVSSIGRQITSLQKTSQRQKVEEPVYNIMSNFDTLDLNAEFSGTIARFMFTDQSFELLKLGDDKYIEELNATSPQIPVPDSIFGKKKHHVLPISVNKDVKIGVAVKADSAHYLYTHMTDMAKKNRISRAD